MGQQNFFQFIVQTLKNSGMIGRILAINSVVYILFLLLQIIEHLFVLDGLKFSVLYYFAAPGNPSELIYKPWSVFTQMFTHEAFGHFFFNMFVFFFTARIFVQFFGERRLLSTYLLGGLFAYLFHIGAYYIFPVFAAQIAPSVIGASGAIMAVFMAVSFYRPSLKVMLFGIIPMPIIIIALLYLWMDLSGIANADKTVSNIAHLAHLGGAIFGMLSILNVNSPKNFMDRLDNWTLRFKLPSFKLKKGTKFKVHKGGNVKQMTDEEFNATKKQRQDRVDAILDKIAKKGYEGLTKEEKDFLFNESQRK